MQTTQTLVTNVIEMALLERLRAQESFTALDISNALKANRCPVRHREVAAVVRAIYASGALGRYGYEATLIPVAADGGAKAAEAYLYHHRSVNPEDYTARSQDALPPVPPDQARDLADCVPADPLGLFTGPTRRRRAQGRQSGAACGCGSRRDGALAIPRGLIAQLGWMVGALLSVKAEPGRLTIGTDGDDSTVRVWGGQRLRVCKTKLQLGALAADIATVEVVGDSLHIITKS
ncbi:MAG TPA: hypothetical protein VFB21_25185 [Chthonomonadaceae bacterium]|nr:hypothetical protein [Chthonomonadaceae bacterium]